MKTGWLWLTAGVLASSWLFMVSDGLTGWIRFADAKRVWTAHYTVDAAKDFGVDCSGEPDQAALDKALELATASPWPAAIKLPKGLCLMLLGKDGETFKVTAAAKCFTDQTTARPFCMSRDWLRTVLQKTACMSSTRFWGLEYSVDEDRPWGPKCGDAPKASAMWSNVASIRPHNGMPGSLDRR